MVVVVTGAAAVAPLHKMEQRTVAAAAVQWASFPLELQATAALAS
jgi:hypothetical protein